MSEVIWNKEGLAHALNSRMDQGKFGNNAKDFIMPKEISDDAVTAWQEFYDANVGNPVIIENEYVRLYQSIIAQF